MMKARMSELELHDLGDEIWDELQPRAERAVGDGVGMIVLAAREVLSRRRGSRRTAAPAGDPPERDKGDLMRSVKAGRTRRSRYGVSQEYGSDHPAAGLHEFGGTITQNGVVRRYPPRSFIRVAEEMVRARVDKRLEEL